MATRTPVIFRDEGEAGDVEIALPFRWAICSCCEGSGKSSAYLGAITEADRAPGGTWDDPEQFRDYMAGAYDRDCDPCEGTGKVKVADEAKMSKAERAEYRAQVRADREIDAEEAAERRAGC